MLDLPILEIAWNAFALLAAAAFGLLGMSLTILRGPGLGRRIGIFALLLAPVVLGAVWPSLGGMGFRSVGRAPDFLGRTELFYPRVPELALPGLLGLAIAGVVAWKRPSDRGFALSAGLLAYAIIAVVTIQAASAVGVYW